jgi:pimeloyl-ACP methyl ester carboxylesterase
MNTRHFLALTTLLLACTGQPPVDTEIPDPDTETDQSLCIAGQEVVQIATQDGVTLAADFASTGEQGAALAILLHMRPPNNDRSNFPPAFIQALNDTGFHVLNVDRRGAGGSDGVAEEAYTGVGGQLDVTAAVDFATTHPCAPNMDRLVLIGASNGTTAALDYTVTAAAASKPKPAAMVFLTGGGYTENQHNIAGQTDSLNTLPLLFVFSTAERDWSTAFDTVTAPTSWLFMEYLNGDHGTRLFDVEPNSIQTIVDWVAQAVP